MKVCNFFHPNLSGKEAEKLLLDEGVDGDFLVRPSENSPENFTLTSKQNNKVIHIKIVNNGEYYSIGSDNSEGFATLAELVQYFTDPNPHAPKIKEKQGDIISLNRIFPCKELIYQRCFHGNLSSKDAEDLLLKHGKLGSFLLRYSQSKPEKLVISVLRSDIIKSLNTPAILNTDIAHKNESANNLFENNQVSHVYIAFQNGKYSLGGGTKWFDDLNELFSYCKLHPLIETSGALLRILHPLNVSSMKASAIPAYVKSIINSPTAFESTKQLIAKIGCSALPNSSNVLKDEYECLRKLTSKDILPRYVGAKAINSHKNRYRNILPFDYTRVILKPIAIRHPQLPDDDYINANYILPDSYMDSNLCFKFFPNPPAPRSISSSPSHMLHAGSNSPNSLTNNDRLRPGSPNVSLNNSPNNMIDSTHVTQILKPESSWYIATQGPLKSTLDDYWRMVWTERSQICVMVTQEVESERIKCCRYWPDLGQTFEYGDLVVTNFRQYPVQQILKNSSIPNLGSQNPSQQSSTSSEDVVRELILALKSNPGEKRTVYHFQCCSWPDHKIPKTPDGVLDFLMAVNVVKDKLLLSASTQNPLTSNMTQNLIQPLGPLVVHCSAGIGRAGSFITLDMIYNKLRKYGLETDIDVQNTVYWIRLQRSGMVQTLQQYTFIYIALARYIEKTYQL